MSDYYEITIERTNGTGFKDTNGNWHNLPTNLNDTKGLKDISKLKLNAPYMIKSEGSNGRYTIKGLFTKDYYFSKKGKSNNSNNSNNSNHENNQSSNYNNKPNGNHTQKPNNQSKCEDKRLLLEREKQPLIIRQNVLGHAINVLNANNSKETLENMGEREIESKIYSMAQRFERYVKEGINPFLADELDEEMPF